MIGCVFLFCKLEFSYIVHKFNYLCPSWIILPQPKYSGATTPITGATSPTIRLDSPHVHIFPTRLCDLGLMGVWAS